jgi:hypothetical protein
MSELELQKQRTRRKQTGNYATKKYEKSNFERKLAPSVDRIDPSKGYIINNIEFITMSENSSRGGYGCMKKRYGYIKEII